MAELDRQDLDTLIDLAIDAGLAEPVRRPLLLAEIPRRLVARLPVIDTPLRQVRSDVDALYRLRMDDGRSGLAHWLDAGLTFVETRATRAQLEAFVDRVKAPPADARTHLDDLDRDARPLEEHLTTITVDVEGAPISQLFNPKAAIVPFDPEVQPGPWQTLTDWCAGEGTVESVLLTGPGGTGKSRMARELAARQKAAGWTVGFLDARVPASALAAPAGDRPLLVLVDYAETRPRVVERLWRLAAGPDARLKLLFLARARGDWWRDATGLGAAGDVARRTIHVELNPVVVPPGRRRALFDAAKAAFEAYAEPEREPVPPPRMEAHGWGRPLLIQLTAWLCLHGRAPDAMDEVLAEMLDAERRVWRHALRRLGGRESDLPAFEQALAIASLCDVSGPAAVERLARLGAHVEGDVARWVDAVYPGGQGLTPDLLGEQLVGERLLGAGVDLGAVVDEGVLEPALTVLTRIWGRTGQGGAHIESLIEQDPAVAAPVALQVALAALDGGDELVVEHPLRVALGQAASRVDVARALDAKLPRRTSTLRAVSATVARTLLDDPATRQTSLSSWLEFAVRASDRLAGAADAEVALELAEAAAGRLAEAPPDTIDEQARAHVLAIRALRLTDTGRREDAVEAWRETVGVCRRLAAGRSARFDPFLAVALNNLGSGLGGLGRWAEALERTTEALEIHRRLAARDPVRFEPNLARTFQNLGRRLSDVGRWDEALNPTVEAVQIARRLAERSPDAFEPFLSDALTSLSKLFDELGQRHEALGPMVESVDIRRRLARRSPQAFEPGLARALNDLGLRLFALGRRVEAHASMVEAVAGLRRLARRSPAAFAPYLANALNNLGTILGELGLDADALDSAVESVTIARRLAAQDPEAFEPRLAGVLSNLGNRLSAVGRHRDALAVAREAVDLRRRRVSRRPDAGEARLAGALSNLSVRLGDVGQQAEALTAAAEAVDIKRRLAAQNPAAFEPELAASLTNLGVRLSALGRRADAVTPATEAVEIYRRLAKRNPAAFEPVLATALSNLGVYLRTLDRQAHALGPAIEAVAICRRLATRHPDAFEPALASSLGNLTTSFGGLGRHAEALASAAEAVEIHRRLVARNPEAFEEGLASALSSLGIRSGKLGRRAEALRATSEAVEIHRRRVDRRPEVLEPRLADAVHNWGMELSESGEHGEALRAAEEVLVLRARTFDRVPREQADRTGWALSRYLRCCRALAVEPVWALVEPIWQVQIRENLNIVPPALLRLRERGGSGVSFREMPTDDDASDGPAAPDASVRATEVQAPVEYASGSPKGLIVAIVLVLAALVAMGWMGR